MDLACKLGQLGRFLVSNPINADVQATERIPSLRQCLLYLSLAASKEEDAYYPIRYGISLISRSLGNYITRQPFRTGKRQKIAEWDNLEGHYDYGKVGMFLEDVETTSAQKKADE
ncbi:hypothetical protein SI65_04538 [Aspergillus cristatus]|uniref:Uncharacterized protein n=1 Tax=Aspergillus cristatus TaxID=573508 RepID=A0A1E3BF19_ASPCR|nr:hypothetical protein SI65_04538 [Aspergillus cristatus]